MIGLMSVVIVKAEETKPDWDNIDFTKITKEQLDYYNNHFSDPARIKELTGVVSQKMKSGQLNSENIGFIFDNLKREVALQVANDLNRDDLWKLYDALKGYRPVVETDLGGKFPRNLELIQVTLTGKDINGNPLKSPPDVNDRKDLAKDLMYKLANDLVANKEVSSLLKEFVQTPEVGKALADLLNDPFFETPDGQAVRNKIYGNIFGIDKINLGNLKMKYDEETKEFMTALGTPIKKYGDEKTGLISLGVEKKDGKDYLVYTNKKYGDTSGEGSKLYIQNGANAYIKDSSNDVDYDLFYRTNVDGNSKEYSLGSVLRGNSGKSYFDAPANTLPPTLRMEAGTFYTKVNGDSGVYSFVPDNIPDNAESSIIFNFKTVPDSAVPEFRNLAIYGGSADKEGDVKPSYSVLIKGDDYLSVRNIDMNELNSIKGAYDNGIYIFNGKDQTGNDKTGAMIVVPGKDNVDVFDLSGNIGKNGFSVYGLNEPDTKALVNYYDSEGSTNPDFSFEKLNEKVEVLAKTSGVTKSTIVPSSDLTPGTTPATTPAERVEQTPLTPSSTDDSVPIAKNSPLPSPGSSLKFFDGENWRELKVVAEEAPETPVPGTPVITPGQGVLSNDGAGSTGTTTTPETPATPVVETPTTPVTETPVVPTNRVNVYGGGDEYKTKINGVEYDVVFKDKVPYFIATQDGKEVQLRVSDYAGYSAEATPEVIAEMPKLLSDPRPVTTSETPTLPSDETPTKDVAPAKKAQQELIRGTELSPGTIISGSTGSNEWDKNWNSNPQTQQVMELMKEKYPNYVPGSNDKIVLLHTTTPCGYCTSAKTFFDNNNIKYVTVSGGGPFSTGYPQVQIFSSAGTVTSQVPGYSPTKYSSGLGIK